MNDPPAIRAFCQRKYIDAGCNVASHFQIKRDVDSCHGFVNKHRWFAVHFFEVGVLRLERLYESDELRQ